MPTPEYRVLLAQQEERVRWLQQELYAHADPAASGDLVQLLAAELKKLGQLQHSTTADGPHAAPTRRFLGPDPSALKIDTVLTMNPVPTVVYHLLDPDTEPLLTVTVHNVSQEGNPRRVQVRAWVEGLSAET